MKRSWGASEEAGMSLVATLIAIAIMGVVVAGFVSVMDFSLRSQTNTQNKSDFGNLKDNLKLLINSAPLCRNAFRNSSDVVETYVAPLPSVPPGSSTAPSYSRDIDRVYFGPSVLVKKNDVVYGGLKIKKIELRSTGIWPTFTNPNWRHFAKIYLEADKSSVATGPSTINNTGNEIYISIDTNPNSTPAHQIVACNLVSPPPPVTTRVFVTNTYELKDRYHNATPHVCPRAYALNTCWEIKNNYKNSSDTCPSGYSGFSSGTVYGLYVARELDVACRNYCVGLEGADAHHGTWHLKVGPSYYGVGFANWNSLGGGPGQGYATGRMVSCGLAGYAYMTGTDAWELVECECSN